MQRLPDIAAEQFGAFTGWQAGQAGWTRSALAHAVRTSRIVRVRPSVFLDHEFVVHLSHHDRAIRAVAGVLTTPGTRVAGAAAASLLDLPLLRAPQLPCVSVERALTSSVPRTHVHRCAASNVLRFGEVTCDGIERALMDIAREQGSLAGVVPLDAALHEGRTTVARMQQELALARGWPGVRNAARAVDLADGRSESPLESRSRIALTGRGISPPATQVSIGNDWGGFVARVDFYWDEYGVVGEADGMSKYVDTSTLRWEKRRQEALEELGLRIVRWGAAELAHLDRLCARLDGHFVLGARPGSSQRRWTVLPDLAPRMHA